MYFEQITRARRTGSLQKTMTDIMLDIASRDASVVRDDLLTAGFTDNEIDIHSRKARRAAESRATRQIGRRHRAA